MKRLFLMLALGCFVAVNFTSCKSKTESPEKVVEAFLNNMSGGDIDKAIPLATAETAEMLKEWQKEGFNIYLDNVIENIECTMISDTEAECSFYADGSRAMLEVMKIDGKWKVHMEK
jgi:hypothetical protein